MQKFSMLFPGQGSQYIGMGKELFDSFAEAKDVFLTVDEALKQNLSKLIFYGEPETLTLTSNAQPAIMATSMATLAVLQKQGAIKIYDTFIVAAGHSLGEYSALAATDALTLEDTAKLLRIRGDAMQTAVAPGQGAMVALIGADMNSAQKLCDEMNGVCQVANDNGAGQIVLSGQANAIQKAHTISSEFGIKKSIILNVSAPFHSSLMESAAQTMLQALQNVSISSTIIDVISNFSVKKHTQGTTRDLLVKQVAGIVRWRETMELLVSDYEQNIFIEVGPGQVLSGIAKRMNPTCQTFSLCSPQSIDDFISYQGKKNV